MSKYLNKYFIKKDIEWPMSTLSCFFTSLNQWNAMRSAKNIRMAKTWKTNDTKSWWECGAILSENENLFNYLKKIVW